jgi:hypothetical protein
MMAGLLLAVERQRGVQNPWLLARGKWFPPRLLWVGRGEMYPAGSCDTRRGKTPEADNWRVAPGPGLRRRCCVVAAELKLECRHLVCPVTDLQGEVMQRTLQDCVRSSHWTNTVGAWARQGV